MSCWRGSVKGMMSDGPLLASGHGWKVRVDCQAMSYPMTPTSCWLSNPCLHQPHPPHPSDAKVGRRPWRNQRCLPTTAFPPRPSIQERSWTAAHRGRTTQLCVHTTVCTHNCVAGHEPTKTTCYMKPGYLLGLFGIGHIWSFRKSCLFIFK